MTDNTIANQTIEKHCIAGFLKNPKKLLELVHLINETDFVHNPHGAIFSILKDSALHNKATDPVIIAERLHSLGITYKGNLDIFNYLQSLSYIKISDKALEDACRRLKTLSIRREIFAMSINIRDAMVKSSDIEADQLISMVDKIYAEKISAYDLSDKPEDLFDNIVEMIEERGDNPLNETGLMTPYKKFNEMYGGLRNGEIYAWVSRPKHGKSTILNDIAFKASMINPNCRALILDTEMQTVDMKYRIASAITGIPMWWLETGNWKKNKELYARFQAKKAELKMALGKVQHMTVARKKVEEITSLIQRWYLGEVGRGNPALVVYDYIKLTGESENNKQEYQLIGEKVDRLKECFLRLHIPLLTACQLNRSAEGGTDDSSAIAQSDRLQWFASQVGIFRRKTIEEIADDGKEFGTHKYIELACRYQGKNAHGHSNLVRVEGEKGKVKYVSNYLNYEVNNFSIEEKGSLEDIQKSKSVQVNVFDEKDRQQDTSLL